MREISRQELGWLIRSDSIVYAKTRAYGYDESTSPDTYMNFPSMARAIKNGMNGSKLSYIFGDCCEIGCVEVAYELRNVADYLIASPAEIPGEGAYYEDLTDLFDTSSSFYQKIIDKYWDFYFNAFVGSSRYYINVAGDLAGYSVPLVAIKTSELENLATATEDPEDEHGCRRLQRLGTSLREGSALLPDVCMLVHGRA